LATKYGTASSTYQKAVNDPSIDDFKHYRDGTYDQADATILTRYKDINNPQGNSPVAASGDQTITANTLYPDQEELNRDNTLNELEEYFQYHVQLRPSELHVGTNFITDVRDFIPNGGTREKWYLFRIPISEYQQKWGTSPILNPSDSLECS
jgi:cell surface protein SprA